MWLRVETDASATLTENKYYRELKIGTSRALGPHNLWAAELPTSLLGPAHKENEDNEEEPLLRTRTMVVKLGNGVGQAVAEAEKKGLQPYWVKHGRAERAAQRLLRGRNALSANSQVFASPSVLLSGTQVFSVICCPSVMRGGE